MSEQYEPTITRHRVMGTKGNNNMHADWPEAMKARLTVLCSTSLSYGQIAAALRAEFPDCPKTRNAVLGKATRMGLRDARPATHAANRVGYQRPDRVPGGKSGITRGPRGNGRPRNKLVVSAPVVFGDATLQVRDEGDRGNANSPAGSRRMSDNDPRVVERRKGVLPCIIEAHPLTSTDNADRRDCQWPTNEEATMVCGVKATCGAYCDRHASVAYRVLPTGKRNRKFHKVDQYQVQKV